MPDGTFVGKINDTSVVELLRVLHDGGASGILDLQREWDQSRIFVMEGEIRAAMSTAVGHMMGQYLVNRGLITGDQLDTALEDSGHDSRLGRKLVRLGFISTELLNSSLHDLVYSITVETLAWNHGLFRLTLMPNPVPAEFALPIPTAWLLFQGIWMHTLPEVAAARLPAGLTLRPSPRLRQHSAELQISPTQAYLLSLTLGGATVEKILAAIPGDHGEILRDLYAFHAAGLLCSDQAPPAPTVEEFFTRLENLARGEAPAPKKKILRPKVPKARPRAR